MSSKTYNIFPFLVTLKKDFFLIVDWHKFIAESVRKEKNYLEIITCISFIV